MTERVTPADVVERLTRARTAGASGLAFDADGTLWSGDVGEDVFEWTTERGFLRPESEDALARVAAEQGVPANGTPSEIARALFAAYRRGRVPESLMCEIMTWCYAGHSVPELADLARQAFADRGLSGRVCKLLEPIREWAAAEALTVIVISASPQPIVSTALEVAGISVGALAAGEPALAGGVIAPSMGNRLPYGAEKPVWGRRLLGESDWLGAFGDNGFDGDMLRAARVGVAVRPKPALVARLPDLPNTVILE